MQTLSRAALLLPVLLAACGDKDEDTAAECTVSTASAGVDAAGILGGAITLDGSASTVCAAYRDAGSASYEWTFERVPVESRLTDAAFSADGGPDAVTTSFTPDVVGEYVVGLTITDPSGTSAADLVVISVESGNAAPVADCGENLGARVEERVELDGSASSDPEGSPLSYSWSLAVAPDCSELETTDVYNAETATPSFAADCGGLYLMSLVVSDGANWSAPDYCSVNVADGNRLPEADAGESVELPFCTDNPLQLNGWGSYDLDGDAITYQWSVVGVPAGSTVSEASFNDTTSAEPLVTWDLAGTYTFELQVHDGTIWSAPDVVTLVIADESTNTTPVANAGSDQRLEAVGDCASSSYVWTCGDCPEASTLLDGGATYDPDGDPLTYQWTADLASVSFSNDHSAVTDIVFPAQPSEFGVANTIEAQATLTARDCVDADADTITVTYTCTGEYLGE
ncbi:PKD domain-containing protein [Myxococcota bacterium]|nr:PKD domain-containing protein [Myxococcota bacterium]